MSEQNGNTESTADQAVRAGDHGDPVVTNKTDVLKNGGQDTDPRARDQALGRRQPAGHQPAGEPAGEHLNDSHSSLVDDQKNGHARTTAPMNPGELSGDRDFGKTQAGHLQTRDGDYQHPAHAGQATMLNNGSEAGFRLQQHIRDRDTVIRCEREGVAVPQDVQDRLDAYDPLTPGDVAGVDSAGNQDVDPVTRNVPTDFHMSDEERERRRGEIRDEEVRREQASRELAQHNDKVHTNQVE